MMGYKFLFLSVLIWASSAGATPAANYKPFATSFLSLSLPQEWACERSQAQYVCRDKRYGNKNYAIIVITAKRASPEDQLNGYETYLKNPIAKVTNKFQELKSKVISLSRMQINGVEWVSGLHLESEVPVYYTRYLATVANGLSVLVTFSFHKDYRPNFETLFEPSIRSMVLLKPPAQENVASPEESLLASQRIDGPSDASPLVRIMKSKSQVLMFVIFAAVCLLFLFLVARRRKR